MACGEYGYGRLAEPETITQEIVRQMPKNPRVESTPPLALTGPQALRGKRVVVTAGPTHEPIDPVRYIANRSSGKQGYAIAAALAAEGADVVLVSGPTRLDPPAGCTIRRVETAKQMLAETKLSLPADAVICAAAVADYHVENVASNKIKKGGSVDMQTLQLAENPDILASIAGMSDDRPPLVVGFAAETENIIDNARAKRERKQCDWIVANDVSTGTETFGGDDNQVTVVTSAGEDAWPRMTKSEVATRLATKVAEALT